jgi:hypothetical protein
MLAGKGILFQGLEEQMPAGGVLLRMKRESAWGWSSDSTWNGSVAPGEKTGY